MLKKRVMALVLAVSMVLGNTATAWAAEASEPISTDGGTVTTDEDGSMQITPNSQMSLDSTESDDSAGQAGSSGDTSGSEAGEVTTGLGGASSLDGADSEGEGISPDASTDGSEGLTPDTGTSIDGSLDTREENAEGTDEDAPLDVPEKAEEGMDTEEDSVSENEVSVSMNPLVEKSYLSEGDYSQYKILVQNNDGSQKHGFDALSEVKQFIFSGEATSEEYNIILQADIMEEEASLQYTNTTKKINLYLAGYDITLLNNTMVILNSVNGKSYGSVNVSSEEKGRVILPANNGPAFRCSSGGEIMTFTDVEFVASNSIFMLGTIDTEYEGDEPCYANFVLTNVDVTGTVSHLILYGDVEWRDSSALNVSTIQAATIRDYYNTHTTETIDQEIYFSMPVTVSNLYGAGADFRVANLTVNNLATLHTDRKMVIEAGGEVRFKNLQINSSLGENMDEDSVNDMRDENSFSFELQRKVQLAEADTGSTPTFVDAQELEARAIVSISGTISKGKNVYYPICFLKYNSWTNGDISKGDMEVAFEENEIIATVTNATVGAANFILSDIDAESCIEKIGTGLKATKHRVEVIAHLEAGDIAYKYSSLESALANLEKDFEKFTGSYTFLFHDNVTLTKNFVIPACVKEAYFATGEYGTDNGSGWQGSGSYHLRTLNLQGYTLEAKGSLTLNEGLRITSKDSAGKNTSAAATLKAATRLYIDESSSLMEEKEEKAWVEITNNSRPAVLTNTNISVPSGEVILRAKDDKESLDDGDIDRIDGGSIIAKDVLVEEGTWETEKITATNVYVAGVKANEEYGEGGEVSGTYIQAAATLIADSITVNKGRADILGNIGQRSSSNTQSGDNPLGILNDSVMTLNAAKLYIGSSKTEIQEGQTETFYGQVNLALLTVNIVYPQESLGDWTIENNGVLYANTINMKAGTLCNNSGRVIANKVNVVNLENSYNSSFIVNNLIQTAAGKTWLCDNSRILVNGTASLNNITLGDRNGNGGQAYLGRSSSGKITLGGTFASNVENQKLYFMVSDSYLKVAELEGVDKDSTWIKTDGSDFIELNKNNEGSDATAFYISNAGIVFPVDNIEIRQPSNQADTLPTAAYQSGNEIRVTSQYIHLFAATTNEELGAEKERHIKSFSTWKECIAYLTAIGNTNTTYTIHLNTTEEINVGGALTLPKNVAKLKIYGVNESGKAQFVSGNITMTTNTEFGNINFADGITINTGGKELIFYNVEDTFAQIIGTAASTINIRNSEITTTKPMAGIGQVNIVNGTLRVNGNFTVQILGLVGGTLDVKGEKSIVTISKELILWHELVQTAGNETEETGDDTYTRKNPSITTEGTVKLANITTYTDGASITYNNSNHAKVPGLTITGTITSMKEDKSGIDLLDVYVVENQDGIGTTAFKIEANKPADGAYEIVKKNSISLTPVMKGQEQENEDIVADTALVNAPQIASVWFVINKTVNTDITIGAVTSSTLAQTTYKDGVLVKSAGGVEIFNVILMQIDSGDMPIVDADDGQLQTFKNEALHLGDFKTLQQAFSEIDRLNKAENKYYILLKADANNLVKNVPADFTFPSKAAYVLIEGENEDTQLVYRTNIVVKANTYFENLVLAPTAASGTLNLGNFEVVLSNTEFADNTDGTEKKIAVTGGGLTKGSYLKLHNLGQGNSVEMTFTAISNVGTLWQSGINVTVTGAVAVNTLRMENSSEDISEIFTGLSTISVKDIITTGGNTIQTLPIYTLNRDSIKSIKAISPRLTITGRVEVVDYISSGDILHIDLLQDAANKESLNITDSAIYDRVSVLLEVSGLPLAKAINADSTYVTFAGGKGNNEDVYKKAGVLIYRDKAPFAYLEYNVVEGKDSTKVTTYCETFADAVAEINNLRTKRAYTIVFRGTTLEENALETLTMPNKNYISHLTLAADGGEVYYKGNITFTSDVTLDNIEFVQAIAVKGENKRAEEVAAGNLPVPVTISTGGFNLYFAEGTEEDGGEVTPNIVSFNTPVFLNGGGKGTLTLHEQVELSAGMYLDVTEDILLGEERGRIDNSTSQIRGKITNFAVVNIDQPVDLLGWSVWNAKTAKQVYQAAELNVTTLNVSETNWMEVGNDYYADKAIVKNLTLTGGELCVTGSGTFTNVTLAGIRPVLSVTAPIPEERYTDEGDLIPPALPICYFAILGTLTNTATDALLESGLNAKAESALNISGQVVMAGSYEEENTDKITVKVSVPPEALKEGGDVHDPITLGESVLLVTEKKKEVEKTIASTLLTAKTADERAFLADASCIGNADTYELDSENGYILKKTGVVISVYYGDQIGAALYIVEGEGLEKFYNYYPTLPDSIAAIEALKNTEVLAGIKGVNADYKIEVLQDVYQLNAKGQITPIKLTMPKNANCVTIMSDTTGNGVTAEPAKQLFITGDISLGCHTAFESVEFMNTNNFLTRGKNLELINIEQYNYPELVTDNPDISNRYADENRSLDTDQVSITFGRIDGGKTGDVRIISTGRTHQFSGGILNINNLTLENVDVLVPPVGNLITATLTLKDADVRIASGTATIKDLKNLGTEINKITYGRNASSKQPNLTISGDIYHADAAKNLVLELDNTTALTVQMAAANSLGTYTLSPSAELVNLDKASMDKLTFQMKEGQSITNVAWANKGVYWIPDALTDKKISVTWEGAKLNESTLEPDVVSEAAYAATCLDIAQASTYIGNRADKTESYTISLPSDIYDTIVTDKTTTSALNLPAKDKADSIIINGQPDGVNTPATLYFRGNITANGDIKFTNLAFANQADFTITNVKNSDIVQNRVVIAYGSADLSFDNVYYAESTDGNTYGKILNIIGVKGWTNVNISGKALEITGGLTNINLLVAESMLTTGGKSEVTTFKLMDGGAWKAMGVTTITDVEVSATGAVSEEANFIATTYSVDKNKNSTGLPLLTIKGSINKEIGYGGIPVKVFTPETGKGLGVTEDGSSDPSAVEKAYDGAKLVIAAKESADKFIAVPYVSYDTAKGYGFKDTFNSGGAYEAFKDGKNYVSNGDISGMEIKLTDDNAEVTYVKSFTEAIQIINTIGDSDANYILELRRTEDNPNTDGVVEGNGGIILTAVDKAGNPVEGALTLPNVKKAGSITIKGDETAGNIILKFTGTIAPKTDLAFENIVLTEMKKTRTGYENLNTVSLNAGTYTVEFREGTKTAEASAKSQEIEMDTKTAKESFFSLTDTPTVTEYEMIFSSITGTKTASQAAEIKMGVPAVYVEKDINIPIWYDNRADGRSESVVAAGGSIRITSKLYSDDTADKIKIKGTKVISIEVVEKARLDINACYTAAAWQRAVSQLTINDISLGANALADVETSLINVNPYVYDIQAKVYEKMNNAQLESLFVTADKNPAVWQKLVTSSKASVVNTLDVENSNFTVNGQGYNVVKYEGGIYITNAPYAVLVEADGQTKTVYDKNGKPTGTVEIEAYVGKFLSWEQAVKEIERQNKLLDYTITVLNTQDEYVPIKAVTMPSKASSLTVVGEVETNADNVTGLVTTAGSIVLKCDTTFENIHLAAVKKSGNGYYTTPMTLNAGNYKLQLKDIPDGNDYYGLGYFESQLAVTGGAKGMAGIDPLYDKDGNVHGNGIIQISRLGEVTLSYADEIEENKIGDDGRTVNKTYYNIKNGISGVGTLKIEEGVYVDCDKKEVSVKDLVIGKALPAETDKGEAAVYPDDYRFPNNPNQSSLEAKNITVTGTATMASARLKAGTTVVGDGKITLTNLRFADIHNHIEGKQDRSGNSLIQIKGTVGVKEISDENAKELAVSVVPSWSAVTIGLTLNNSTVNYAKLAEGMNFLTAPKAASSWFRPYYGDTLMGPEITVTQKTADGKDYKQALYGLYKSGNYIKYGKLMEKTGDLNADGTAELRDLGETRVFIGSLSADNTYDECAYSEYLTFEEAVNGINSMALQKEVMVNGKATKANEDYTIEVLRDVEIGNAKSDGRYSVLTLPTKVGELTVFGYGSSIRFSGNIAVRSNTTLESGITLTPMKAVKGGAEPTTTNIAVGNFKLTFAGADVGYWNEDSKPVSLLNNLTGGAKGELIIAPGSGIEAVNVTGLNKVVFKGNGSSKTDASQSQGEKQIVEILEVTGKINVKSILAKDYAVATLMNGQGLTANVIGQDKNSELTIHNPAEIPMRLNGGKLSEVGSSTTETGSVYSGSGSPINLKMVSSSGTVLDGTKMITGKYLKKSDWKVDVLAAEWDTETARNIYANGNDLYLGSEYIQ